MANCTHCGAPVSEDVHFCLYCGTKLNVVDENLGKLILSNTEAIKRALAQPDRHFGMSGKHLEPVSFRDLNAEYFMPLLETADGAIVVARLTDGDRLSYQIMFTDEDPVDMAWDQVQELVLRNRVSQWFCGWLRCPKCLKRYHITYADPAIMMRVAECPHCVIDRAVQAATAQVEDNAARLQWLEAEPPKKPNFFSTEEQRHEYQRWEQARPAAPADLADSQTRLTELEDISAFVAQRSEQPLSSADQVQSWLTAAIRIRD